MNPFLTRETARRRMNRTDLQDLDAFPAPYLDAALATVQDAIGQFLQRDLALAAHVQELGLVEYVSSGRLRGRYFFELRHWPLVPGEADQIFSLLELRYSVAFSTNSSVISTYESIEHDTGQVTCLAPGMVEALGFAAGSIAGGLRATGYRASYTAGYATGIHDPLTPLAASYGAAPLPESVKEAAVLLLREKLAVDAALNANPDNPQVFTKTLEKGGDQEDRYSPIPVDAAMDLLGFGTPLSAAAVRLLRRFKVRRHLLAVI